MYTYILSGFLVIYILKKYKKSSAWVKITLGVVMFVAFILLGFRDVGFDMESNRNYYIFSLYKYTGTPEPGYQLLMYFSNKFLHSYKLATIVVSLLSCILIYKYFFEALFIQKYTSLIFIGFFSTVFFYYFGLMRMGIAIAFYLNASLYIEKNRKKYYLWTICAGLFHYSAFVLLILPIALSCISVILKKFKNFVLILTVTCLITLYGAQSIIMLLFRILSKLDFFWRYENYFNSGSFDIANISPVIYIVPMILIVIIINKFIDNRTKNFTILITLLCLIQLFFGTYRFAFYLTPYIFDIYGKIGEKFDYKSEAIYKLAIVICLLIFVEIVIFDSPFLGEYFIPYSLSFIE